MKSKPKFLIYRTCAICGKNLGLVKQDVCHNCYEKFCPIENGKRTIPAWFSELVKIQRRFERQVATTTEICFTDDKRDIDGDKTTETYT